jgi:hypothetical protein
MEFFINTTCGRVEGFRCIADLDVIVFPTQVLVPLQARKEFGFGDEKADTGDCISY